MSKTSNTSESPNDPRNEHGNPEDGSGLNGPAMAWAVIGAAIVVAIVLGMVL